jgi:hypothetical protein
MVAGNGEQTGPKIQVAFPGQSSEYTFVPLDDITASELASALVLLHASIPVMLRLAPPKLVDVAYEQLPDDAKRHFQRRVLSGIVIPK